MVCISKNAIIIIAFLLLQLFLEPSYLLFLVLTYLSMLERKNRHLQFIFFSIILILYAFKIRNKLNNDDISVGSEIKHSLNNLKNKIPLKDKGKSLSDVFILQLNSKQEKRFFPIIQKILKSRNAIVFSAKLDHKVFNIFSNTLNEFSYIRKKLAADMCIENIKKEDIVLTYLLVGGKKSFYRLSYQKEFGIIINNRFLDVDARIFDITRRINRNGCTNENYLDFIKFYSSEEWSKIQNNVSKYSSIISKQGNSVQVLKNSLSYEEKLFVFDIMKVDFRAYLELEYAMICKEDFNSYMKL